MQPEQLQPQQTLNDYVNHNVDSNLAPPQRNPPFLSNEEQELIKKQQKIDQIKGLSDLEQKMQMQSYQKLVQLKKLQQMKEQAEKNQNNL